MLVKALVYFESLAVDLIALLQLHVDDDVDEDIQHVISLD